ncbi:MAG TPA: DUF748 domain-containing protein [Saprospiraceae bacterium]|nr:DUF748 domain-containing protein [Saprospiraceae bacterium]
MPPKQTKISKRRKVLTIVLSIVVILFAIRLILPYVILKYVNKNLSNIEGYFGHVDDIDLSLYRGAYIVKHIFINKLDSVTNKQTPLFSCPNVDLSVEWRSLFKGRIVSELELKSPVLQFTEDKAEPEQMEKDTNDFRHMLRTFTPVKVNKVEIFDGTIGYLDNTVKPVVDVHLDNTHILAKNLSNVTDTTLLPANIEATANVYGGTLAFNMRIDALANDPTYDMNLEIKNANLVRLNDFFKAYADFDINKGTFGMYMELAAKDRKFIGYVKPFINDLDVVGPEDRHDSFFRKIWEGIVGVAADILENPKSDKIATKIPIAGAYDDRTIGVWYAILATLRNGFIQAIYPSLDYQVSINSVKAVDAKENKEGLFKKIFGKPGENKQKKDKN